MTNDLKWLIASDFQIPYQDDRATKLFFNFMKWFKPDVVDLLGDIDDQNCYSRYSDGKPDEFLLANQKPENEETFLKLV